MIPLLGLLTSVLATSDRFFSLLQKPKYTKVDKKSRSMGNPNFGVADLGLGRERQLFDVVQEPGQIPGRRDPKDARLGEAVGLLGDHPRVDEG
jgi:hypothetical protein